MCVARSDKNTHATSSSSSSSSSCMKERGKGEFCCMFVVVVVVVTDERSTIKSWVWVDLRKKTREGVEFLVGER